MTDNEARLLTQVADVIEEADILRRKLEISEKINRNLRCCGNCKNNHITNIDTYCEITGEEVNGHKVCAKWQSDGKKRKDRE